MIAPTHRSTAVAALPALTQRRSARSTEWNSKMPTLLIIEPDSAIRELLNEMLSSEGFRVAAMAECPDAALVYRIRPDGLILTLPPMDPTPFMQLISQLRRCADTRLLPILTMTTNDHLLDHLRSELDQLRCAMLLQPFDVEVLLSWTATLPS